MLSREQARLRVLQRLKGGGMGAYPWYGAGMVGWYFGPEDKQQLLSACGALAGAIADAQAETARITNASAKGPYENQLRSMAQMVTTYRSNAENEAVKSKVQFEQMLAYLTVAGPKALATMRPLILADQRDPSGETAEKMIKGQIESISKQQAEVMSSWYMDPEGWMKRQIEEGGKAVSGTLFGIQWALLKGIWPLLLVGGGIAALWYFGPALSVVAKRLAGRVPDRVPGDLPPGVQQQPGD